MYGLCIADGAKHIYPLKALLTDVALTSNKIDASAVGSPTLGADRHGNASLAYNVGRFSGTHKYLTWADDNSFSIGNGTTDTPYTHLMWIYVADYAGGNFWFFGKDDATTHREWQWTLQVDTPAKGAIAQYRRDNSAGVAVGSLTSSAVVSDATWTHIAMSSDGAGGATATNNDKIYKNGISEAVSLTNNGSYVACENTTTSMRTTRNGGTVNTNGRIAMIKMYDRQLSDYEVKLNYAMVA